MQGMTAGRWVGKALFTGLYRLQVRGAQHVPSSGPIVVVANHVGFIDGPLAFSVCPRPVRFLVKRSYFHGPLGALLRGVGQIPITQNSADRSALTSALNHLKADGAVGIFPEGTRGAGDVATAQQGAAWLALASGATIVPAALTGTAGRTKSSLPRVRSTVTVTFGAPFRLDEAENVTAASGRERLRQATEVIRERLATHVRDT